MLMNESIQIGWCGLFTARKIMNVLDLGKAFRSKGFSSANESLIY